jgi:hypothetical protein
MNQTASGNLNAEKPQTATKSYLVDITIGNFYQLEIEASSSDEALAKAQTLLDQDEFEAVACAQPYITEWNCEPL